jgi:hypothetical protein
MTMADMKCDVCRIGDAIGVASTAIPLSVAYCAECAKRNAQPLAVFMLWEEEIPPDDHRSPDAFCTFEDGKYISYRKWYDGRRERKIPIDLFDPKQASRVSTKPEVPEGD